MTTVRDLYLEAQSMKERNVNPRQIRELLLDRGHQIGNMILNEIGQGETYVLVFSSTGEKIGFDGVDYHFAWS